MSELADLFFQQYKYYPQRAWKNVGPADRKIEGTISEDHVPPLQRQQRHQMNQKLQKDVMDDRFLFFLRALFYKVMEGRPNDNNSNLMSSSSSGFDFIQSFPKSYFRQRINPHRSLFNPLPWKLLTKDMTPISSVFANVPILLQGSMNKIQYCQLLHSFMVGSFLNRLRYRIPFFLYTYGVMEVVTTLPTSPVQVQSKNHNVLLVMTESPFSPNISGTANNSDPQQDDRGTGKNPYLSLEDVLRHADITVDDFFHIFLQCLILLHHIQFYLGITIHNLSLDRIVCRPVTDAFPPFFSFHMYGREFQLKRGNYLVQFRGWSDSNYRDHPEMLFDLNMTYWGSVEGKRSTYSSGVDVFDFLVAVRKVCIQVLQPKTKGNTSSTSWEYKLHLDSILKFVHLLWARFYDFPTDSVFWLETLPTNITVYESLACSKTPALFLDFILQNQTVWKADLGIHNFPLTVRVRESLLPPHSSVMAARLPRMFEDFVIPRFYPAYEEVYRKMGWFAMLSSMPSLDELEIEMNALVSLYQDQTLQEFEFKAPLSRSGQVLVDVFSFYDKTYMRPSSPFYGKLKGTYAFLSRVVVWMENMYFLQSYRYEEFAKFQKRNRKMYSLLVKIYADGPQMTFFEQIVSFTEMIRNWVDKYTVIKTTQLIIRSPFQQQQQNKQTSSQSKNSFPQQYSLYSASSGPRFTPPIDSASVRQQQQLFLRPSPTTQTQTQTQTTTPPQVQGVVSTGQVSSPAFPVQTTSPSSPSFPSPSPLVTNTPPISTQRLQGVSKQSVSPGQTFTLPQKQQKQVIPSQSFVYNPLPNNTIRTQQQQQRQRAIIP